MKTVLLFLTTSFVCVASAAWAQGDECSKRYSACMDHCSSRPQSVQASCSQTCENNTDQCYVGMYGPAPAVNAPAVSEPAGDAQDSAAPAAGTSAK